MIDVEISKAAKGSTGTGGGAESAGSLQYASVAESRHSGSADLAVYAERAGRAETAAEAEGLTADSATRGDFLSAKEADTAEGEITFAAGLKVGDGDKGIGADGTARVGPLAAESLEVSGGATVWGGSQLFGETSTEDITNSGSINNAGDITNGGNIDNGGDITNDGGTITTKNLTVTGLAKFFELLVGKVKAVGGNVVITPGDGFTADAVEATDGGKRLYWLAEKDGKATRNCWEAGDLAVSRSFNSAKAGALDTAANKYWWAEVTATSGESPVRRDGNSYHYIDVKADGADGDLSGAEAGDEVAQLGNRSDASRQGAIIISAFPGIDTELGAPSIAQYTGINDFSLSSRRKSWWGHGADGKASNRFVGETCIVGSDGSEESVAAGLLEVRNDSASLKAQMDGVSAKVATSVQYDPATGRITSDVTLAGDKIDLSGYVTANKEFRIDKWGNVMTGTTLRSAGRYIVEDISNIVFAPATRNSGTAAYVFLPNDPEYIGRRIEIIAQPYVNSAGAVESGNMTVCVRSGRTLVGYVYGTGSGDGASAPDAFAGDGAGTLEGQGLEYFGGGYTTDGGLAPSKITLRGGHVTLLGIAYGVSRMWKSAAGRIEAVSDMVFKPAVARSSDGRIDDEATGWSGSGAESSVGMDGGTEYDGENSEAWSECAELCRWIIIDENGAEMG